tara:strand:- start:5302 stop:5580 length:279 start_codon:yes stop_codon:yes gene_type:complete
MLRDIFGRPFIDGDIVSFIAGQNMVIGQIVWVEKKLIRIYKYILPKHNEGILNIPLLLKDDYYMLDADIPFTWTDPAATKIHILILKRKQKK